MYAVDHDSFGHIIGAVGPLDPDKLQDLADYHYSPGIASWVEEAIRKNALHRINPQSAQT